MKRSKNNVIGTLKTARTASHYHGKEVYPDINRQGSQPDQHHGSEQAAL